jgi:hypothetical protein
MIKKAIACVVFNEKPFKYLLLGKTLKGTGSQVIDDAIAHFLPMHGSLPKGSTDAETAAMTAARAKFPKAFQLINVTQIKAVSNMVCQCQAMMSDIEICPQTMQWIARYGGGPTVALSNLGSVIPEEIVDSSGKKVSNPTYTIKRDQLTKFKSDSKFWEPIVDNLVATFRA